MTVSETAQSLVRIPSVNPGYDPESSGEAGVVDWLLGWASEHGFDVNTQEVFPNRYNVILRLRNGADRPHLLLNGHTDTVAVLNMTIPPFGGELHDGRLWGRGAADMKGPLACMLHSLLVMRDHPSRWRGTITLACVVDEELGFAGIKKFLEFDEVFDFAVVGEPTKLEVVRGCKGCLRFSFRAHGKAAHSSTPEKGTSAISAMAGAITALDQFFANRLTTIRHLDLGPSTGSVGLIHGGSGINIVPDFCEASVDVRLVPGQSWQETYNEIQQAVHATNSVVRWEFDSQPMADPPFCLENDNPVVTKACESLGRDISQVVNFSCDASKIAATGVPCLVVGPGDIAHAHTATESIAVEELLQGVEAYTKIAEALLPV